MLLAKSTLTLSTNALLQFASFWSSLLTRLTHWYFKTKVKHTIFYNVRNIFLFNTLFYVRLHILFSTENVYTMQNSLKIRWQPIGERTTFSVSYLAFEDKKGEKRSKRKR